MRVCVCVCLCPCVRVFECVCAFHWHANPLIQWRFSVDTQLQLTGAKSVIGKAVSGRRERRACVYVCVCWRVHACLCVRVCSRACVRVFECVWLVQSRSHPEKAVW